MKSTCLQFSKQQELLELFQNPSYSCNVILSVIISVDEDVISIQSKKNIELLSKDFDDKFLEACRYVCSLKKYHLVLKVTILSPEYGFLLVFFMDSYLMICTDKIKLDKPSSPS